MNKILFINPPNMPFSSNGILIEPIDTLHVATYIESLGYCVSFLDMDVKKLTSDNLSSIIKINKPDIAIIVFDYHIPLHDAGANNEINFIIGTLRKNEVISILGGKAATFYNHEQLKIFAADIFIKHDLEKPLEMVLNMINKYKNWHEKLENIDGIRFIKNNKLINTKNIHEKINLDLFPIPNRNLLNLNDYIDVRTILSSRGCNLKCSFCHVPGFWGNWKGRLPEHVVNEIKMLYSNFNSNKVLFLDDNAMANPNRMNEISNLLIKSKIKISLGCLGTIISFNEDIMKNMFKAGFRWIHYGAESGDDYQLKAMGKKITSEQTLSVIKKTKEIGFRVRTSWILDMPDLTLDGLLRTENLICEQDSDEIRLHFLTIRLGSLLHNKHSIETRQFIHSNHQNLNISGVSEIEIKNSLNRILKRLSDKGYTIIINPDDFIDIPKLTKINPKLKIVSLCPLRYGLGWKYE